MTIPGRALLPEQLRRRCAPESLPFRTTADLTDGDSTLGHERAIAALELAVSMTSAGHNVYVMGPAGSGRHSTVQRVLARAASTRPAPCDWCYVYRFDDPRRPRALRLAGGQGTALRNDLRQLVEELRSALPAAFESEAVRNRRSEIDHEFEERNRHALEELQADAEQHQLGLVQTPQGFAIAPMHDGEVQPAEEFERRPEAEKREIQQHLERISTLLQKHVERLPDWQREHRQRVRDLAREVVSAAVGNLIGELRRKYAGLDAILAYLREMEADLLENPAAFERGEPQVATLLLGTARLGTANRLERYDVNVVVNSALQKTAPVIYESNPTLHNLVGRVENIATFGALTTDFTMIRAGALHRANGGFLILDAERLLSQPYAWEALKRALSERTIRIESIAEALSLISTVSLEPEPIPLQTRVILIGSRQVYYLLHALDPDFAEHFKLLADFDERIDSTPRNVELYALSVAALARREHLRPFTAEAVAALVEHGMRLAEDTAKLSTHLRSIEDAAREADHLARADGVEVVRAEDVQKSLAEQVRRQSRLQGEILDAIQRNTLLIDCAGQTVGQINALSVINLGSCAFGHPTRITAAVRLGSGEVIDIEREVKLGGPSHSKGVLILAALLGSRYCLAQPLSLQASLVFEQSYSGVEGDSASLAETCALLSALAGLPLRQALAVTGSVNQLGVVQAVGGVNEKIEGFFEVCRTRGLTGDQGIVMPANNVEHLMLREDVVTAARDGKFRVHAVRTVDEAMELLTGVPAGERDSSGAFPQNSVNARVENRLQEFAHRRREFSGPDSRISGHGSRRSSARAE